ncbi:hypothetical protein [Phenylobacterium deserti]|uniref:Uncharacterized protein n=1 Tax=Phenylobacterium deserti TaxID=1914756 RepID=A0A328APU6_9CAUL|nr:hypothetical protein [Phenylobacterium deserti]RAK57010.1 hypothetical protein DJ018_03340 [Phenylobacterium deserti]
MNITFLPIEVALHPRRTEGLQIFCDGALCAVLTRLDEEVDPPGGWFVEAAFGALDDRQHPSFLELNEVEAWVRKTLSDFLK